MNRMSERRQFMLIHLPLELLIIGDLYRVSNKVVAAPLRLACLYKPPYRDMVVWELVESYSVSWKNASGMGCLFKIHMLYISLFGLVQSVENSLSFSAVHGATIMVGSDEGASYSGHD